MKWLLQQKVDTIRRCAEPNGKIHGQHDAKGNGAHAKFPTNRQQNRRQNDGCRNVVNEHTDKEQEQVDEKENDESILADTSNEPGNLHRNLFHGQEGGKGGRQTNHERRRPVDNNGILERLIGGRSIQFLINETPYDIGINNRYNGCFRRRKFTGVDTAQNDNRGKNGPNRILKRGPNDTGTGWFRAASIAAFFETIKHTIIRATPINMPGRKPAVKRLVMDAPETTP